MGGGGEVDSTSEAQCIDGNLARLVNLLCAAQQASFARARPKRRLDSRTLHTLAAQHSSSINSSPPWNLACRPHSLTQSRASMEFSSSPARQLDGWSGEGANEKDALGSANLLRLVFPCSPRAQPLVVCVQWLSRPTEKNSPRLLSMSCCCGVVGKLAERVGEKHTRLHSKLARPFHTTSQSSVSLLVRPKPESGGAREREREGASELGSGARQQKRGKKVGERFASLVRN